MLICYRYIENNLYSINESYSTGYMVDKQEEIGNIVA